MGLPIWHTSVGASIPALIGYLWCRCKKKMTSKMLWVMFVALPVCALWAEIPDAFRYWAEQGTSLHQCMVRSGWGNIFFFHALLDTYELPERGAFIGLFILMSIFFVFLFLARKAYVHNEEEIAKIIYAQNEENRNNEKT